MTRYLFGASLLALASPAAAQTKPPVNPPVDDGHQHDVVVTGVLQRSERDVLSGTSVVTGEELARDLRPSLGETLARQPGVSATSFGPTASRPILRGFQGDRVRVLTDGIGSIDVSNVSVDHPVVIDPLLAERIEVLRGPAALLFGSSAVGGVVNVIDTRIPRRIPENGSRVSGLATYGSAANERAGSAAADVAVGGPFVLHADGSYFKSGDLRTGGYLLSPAARRAALATAAQPHDHGEGEEHDEIDFARNASLRGKLPNSAAETWTAGVGASIVTDTGHLGISYSHYDSLFGIPVRYATEEGQEEEAPRIDVVQNRVDLRADIETGGGFLERVRLRAGHADYRHFELGPDNDIHTAFYNKGTEGRLELVQARKGAWLGASGVQYFNRTFDVIGEEAFLPRNETSQVGLFTLQQIDAGALKAEGGLRWEKSDLTAKPPLGTEGFYRGTRSFSALSGSAGASYALNDAVRFGVNVSRTERAPSAEELFANGNHAGTQSYELGNPNFRLEKSWGVEATLHAHGDGFSFDGSAYHNWFSNFIYLDNVDDAVCEAAAPPHDHEEGGEDDHHHGGELPCFQAQQADARIWGVEAEASVRLARLGGWTLNADLLGDMVRASLKDGGPLPRIPAARLLGGLEAQSERATARIEAEHVFEQNRTAAFETPTADYTVVNASVAWSPFASHDTQLLLSANNIFDVVARRHASFLKDFAPLAGRDIRATLRFRI
jgi:iron complex outermembrane receptor protein